MSPIVQRCVFGVGMISRWRVATFVVVESSRYRFFVMNVRPPHFSWSSSLRSFTASAANRCHGRQGVALGSELCRKRMVRMPCCPVGRPTYVR